MTFGRFASAFAAAAFLFVPSPVLAQVQITQVFSGLTQPVFVGHAGDGTNRMFIVERAGIIRVAQPGSASSTVFLDIRSKLTSASGEQGLLGLAFHPQYETNRRFFVSYTKAGTGAFVIAEYGASSNPNVANPLEKPLLEIPHPFTNHNGGMLAFGPDGYLYIGSGDGGSGNDPNNYAQNKDSLLGKILRIDINTPGGFLSPVSNPFYGAVPGREEVFAFGMRNPWRFSFDRVTGQMWVGDVGQGAREEIDSPIVSGGNYGWRVFEGTNCTGIDPAACNPANYLAPVIEYAHAGGRCSVTGGYVYRGQNNALSPGTYVFGDYCTGEIFARTSGAPVLLIDTAMRISSFGEDEAGEIYVANYSGGTIGRLTSVSGGGGGTVSGGGTTTCTSTRPGSDWVCVNGGWVPPSLAPSGGSTGGGTTGGGTTTSPTGCTTQKPASDWVCVNGGWVPPSLAPAGGSTGGGTTSGGTTTTPSSLPLCTNSTGAPGSGWVKLSSGGWVPTTHSLASSGICRAP